MKIGIVVYSQTGNTMQVAEKLNEALTASGHAAVVERITAEQENTKDGVKVTLTHAPDASAYDMIYFAAPVHAFSLCPVMKTYLQAMDTLNGKQVACVVTQHFPKAWMGGNHAMRQMRDAIQKKGGSVVASGIVNWSSKTREAQIGHVVAELATASPVQV